MNELATEKRQIFIKSTIVFWFRIGGAMTTTRTSSRIRHYDVILTSFVTKYALQQHLCEFQKNTILLLCRSVFSPFLIHSLFLRLHTPKVWPYMVMWREIWISLITCNFAPFYPIEMGFFTRNHRILCRKLLSNF